MSEHHSHEHHNHSSHAHIPQDKKNLSAQFLSSLLALWLSNLLVATGLTVWHSWLMQGTWQMIVYRYF